jgi:hypothetical protein
MRVTVRNDDEATPVIFRVMRRENGDEIDSISEAQLLPGQETEIEITSEQSLTVLAR